MPPAPTAALERRHAAVRQALTARELDALLVTSLPNIVYLTNFTGSAAALLLDRDRLTLVTDFRYVTAVEALRATPWECPGLTLARVDGAYDDTIVRALTARAGVRVGFEAAHLSVSRFRWIESKLPQQSVSAPAPIATEGIVERARATKDAYEIATLREAARRLSVVARSLPEIVARGRTERAVALDVDWRVRAAGFEKAAFDTIVASGPNAALPHARPGERILTESDLVVLDFGGVYDSYCVDLTRTVSVGRADNRVREVYAAVRDAHDRAIAAVAPGRSRFEIDGAAREAMAAHGLAEAFGHGTGHGLGLEVHEDPRITRRRPGLDDDVPDEAVAAGMVFTIEPGAYLPGWGGIRIEDDVLVAADGVEILTDAPMDLIEI